MRARTAAVLLAAVLGSAACFHRNYQTAPRVAVVDGDPIVQMASPDKFPSLVNPRSVPYRLSTAIRPFPGKK